MYIPLMARWNMNCMNNNIEYSYLKIKQRQKTRVRKITSKKFGNIKATRALWSFRGITQGDTCVGEIVNFC